MGVQVGKLSFKSALWVGAIACFGLATFGIASGRLVPAGLLCASLAVAL